MSLNNNIVVFGFGAQGSVQAKILRDHGRNVAVYLRPSSPKIEMVKREGITPITDAALAARRAEIAVLLLPDGEQPTFWHDALEPHLPPHAAVIFAHGFNLLYHHIRPRTDLDVMLVAPLAHSDALHANFQKGRGTPCIIAIAQNATGHALSMANDYAQTIAGLGPFIHTTVREEVESDLFAEQAVLCGGLSSLILAAFETMVAAGFNHDIAYFTCLKEVPALADLIDRHGMSGMHERISDTARYGSLTRGPRVIDQHVRATLQTILAEIQSGVFERECRANTQRANDLLDGLKHHAIENIRRRVET